MKFLQRFGRKSRALLTWWLDIVMDYLSALNSMGLNVLALSAERFESWRLVADRQQLHWKASVRISLRRKEDCGRKYKRAAIDWISKAKVRRRTYGLARIQALLSVWNVLAGWCFEPTMLSISFEWFYYLMSLLHGRLHKYLGVILCVSYGIEAAFVLHL